LRPVLARGEWFDIPDFKWHCRRWSRPHERRGVIAACTGIKPSDVSVTLRRAVVRFSNNGKPLSREHGAPLRLLIPEMYGYKNVKWVARIEVIARPGSGYWEQRGYDRNAWVGRSNGYG
jgi:hypothetical protein